MDFTYKEREKEFARYIKTNPPKRMDLQHANIIDCGLLLMIDGKSLKAFVESNGFGFQVWNNVFLHDLVELQEIANRCELIEV